MSLSAGSVTIAEDGSATGEGLAFALYQSTIAPFGGALPPASKQAHGAWLASISGALVEYFKANAEIVVTIAPADAGLQRTPNPNNPDTATQGPAAPVELTSKGRIT